MKQDHSPLPLWTLLPAAVLAVWLTAGAEPARPETRSFDVLIRGGTVVDGSGKPPRPVDVGISGDRIVAVGDLAGARGKVVVEAKGLAVAPGFINMLSWSTDSLLADGRSQSEIRQGVTTQIMGEGWSWGPVNAAIKKRMKAEQTDIKYDIEWTTLSDYLYFLQRRKISTNVASFLGAATVREYVLGLENRKPSDKEREQMRQLVEREMRDGALGIASALEYAPAYYADTEELIDLVQGGGPVQGQVHLAHAQRGEQAAGGDRRGDQDQPPRRRSRPRSTTSRRRASRTGRRWMRQSPGWRRRGRRGWPSRPTCTATRPGPPGWTPASRRGRRTAAATPCTAGLRDPRDCASASRRHPLSQDPTGRTSTATPVRRTRSC